MTLSRALLTTLPLITLAIMAAGAWADDPASSAPAKDRTGLIEDCSAADGWYERSHDGQRSSPRAKLEAKDGVLHVHTNRGLLFSLDRYKWPVEGIVESSTIHKDYGEVDLDKYHYMVVDIQAKGSGAQFSINNLGTKLGYTTGITAIDLRDYDEPSVKGRQKVTFRINLHDNLTTLELKEIKLVSSLSDEETKRFIGAGLTIRDENVQARELHGLTELKRRENVPPPDGQEQAIYRDSATGAICTRLTCGEADSYIGEGGIWSGDGAAIKFNTKRQLAGTPVYSIAQGKLMETPKAGLTLWSNVEPSKLFLITGRRMGEQGTKPWKFTASWWDHKTGQVTPLTEFVSPEVGGYFEAKRLTRTGKLIVAFRETPHMFIVDPAAKAARHVELSTRLKDPSITPDERYVHWYNCYTYESRWRDLQSGEEGVNSGSVVGHACGGPSGTVGSFGPYLKIFVPAGLGHTRQPGDKISVWANWQNRVYTDYGTLTADSKWIFTNGTRGDVDKQHVMVPSDDTGAVLRIVRHFTKFSWTSPTYSRPSPDYTKLVFCDNFIGPAQLIMAYTRRPDAPTNVKLDGNKLTWKTPERSRELAGFNVYRSTTSGRDFVRINKSLVTDAEFEVPKDDAFYAVTAVENSTLESLMSGEVKAAGGARTFYFEAEEMTLTPPARRFFDGYANGFQCVRINAESAEEKAADGVVLIDTKSLPAGEYRVWARVKGKGTWKMSGGGAEDPKPLAVDAPEWKWVQLGQWQQPSVWAESIPLTLASRDDALMLDTVMLSADDVTPVGADPRDAAAPAAVKNLRAVADADKGTVQLTWDAPADADVQHYSVYCGTDKDFACDNGSLVRSTRTAAVTDAGMTTGKKLFYKVVAVDGRWNASDPAVVEVPPMPEPTTAATTQP